MRKLIIVFIIYLNSSINVFGQDHIYSQFYNSPIYLNPALNGQFDGDFRMNMIYRSQWTGISGPLNYYSVSADFSIPKLGGGLGIIATRSSEGVAYLNRTNLSAIYSYSVEFGYSGTLSFGLQSGLTNRSLDYDKLLFYDQLNEQGIIPGGISAASPLVNNSKYYFDAAAGLNMVVGNLMIGAAGHHINRPNESLTGTVSNLPMRLTAYMSYKLSLDYNEDDDSPYLTPSVVYQNQSNNQSISAGFQIKKRGVNAGIWYRGQTNQRDAIVFSLIFDIFSKKGYAEKIRMGLSHDATTSKLGYGNTSGTTEAAFVYESSIFNSTNSGGGNSRFGNYGKKCYDFY
jgi:type IX secretion system PorP/SprF family membrane protein